MATSGLYGSTSTGTVAPQSGSESVGLYGNNTVFGGSYFEWFIFQESATAPATPTGGSWSFVTNVGTPPAGWSAIPPAAPTNKVWVSIALVNSKSTATLSWSVPGQFTQPAGTVTSVAALTLGTTGTDVSSTVANSTTTPVITLNLPTASATNRGALSAADWTTFNSKGSGTVTSVSGTAPVVSSGGTTPAISMAAATTSTNGYLTSTDWSTFNSKGSGSVTSVAATVPSFLSVAGSPITTSGTLAISYSGTALPVANGGTGVTTSTGTGSVVLSTSPSLTTPTQVTYENWTPISEPSYAEGRVWYDSNAHALAYFNDAPNSVAHVGHELQVKVINNTGSSIPNGSPVYITSTSSGQTYPNIALARADVAATASVIGLTNGAIANGAFGYVVSAGTIDDVNTGSYTVGQVLYLSPYSAGQLMNTLPPTGLTVQVGVVEYVNSSTGKIYVKQTTPLSIPASILSGTVAIANGGTGQATQAAAITALAGTQASGQYLRSNGTNTLLSAIQAADVPTLNQNTTGTASNVTGTVAIVNGGTGLTTTPANGALDIGNGTGFTRTTLTAGTGISVTNASGSITIASSGGTGTVTSVAATVPSFLSIAGSPITASGTLAISYSGTALPVANGGTGVTTSTGTGNVVLSTSPTLVTPALGTPASGVMTNVTGINYDGFKNRIINGAMVIDQRNAGASASLTSSQTYFVDRFFGVEDTDGTMTIQRSTTAPTGFINSLLMTTTSADASLGATQICYVGQKIEGLNVADLAWGTASAATVTISFWVRSSLTGTFGGAVSNNAFVRSYPFTYTISTANTFEQKTITIAGDTTGTWPTDNGSSIQLFIGLGVGSTYSGTAGAWAGSGYISATGATSVIGTNGATFYITGVQLEKGSTATSFDVRSYGTELALCQRYFETNYGVGYAIGSANSYPNNQGIYFQGFNTTSGQKHVYDWFKVPKRAVPTATYYDWAGNSGKFSALDAGGTATNNQSIGYTPVNQNNIGVGATSTNYGIAVFWTASAEL